MGSTKHRDLLRRTAAASALIALRGRAQPLASPSEEPWTAARCPCCDARCAVRVNANDATAVAVRLEGERSDGRFSCAKGLLLREMLDVRARTIAGVLLVTAAGAAPRVAARLIGAPGLELTGGDGDSRLAAVWEAGDGAALEAAATQLLRDDPEVVGVHATFVGSLAAG
jgi:hypothetical protein